MEQVLIFALGISITLGFLYAFQDLGNKVGGDLENSQSDVITSYVSAAYTELVQSGADGSMIMEIPEEVGGEPYRIGLMEGGVEVQTPGKSAEGTLYGLEKRFDLEGSVLGEDRRVQILRQGENLSLWRAE